MANYATVKNRESDQISERYQRGNFNKQDPVVTKVYNTVLWINLYRAYNTSIFSTGYRFYYPMDSCIYRKGGGGGVAVDRLIRLV